MPIANLARIALCLNALVYGPLCYSEIYRWVDDRGRVHYSDKSAAVRGATVLGEKNKLVSSDGKTYTFLPEADTLLSKGKTIPKGTAPMLSTGYWNTRGKTIETKSLIQFDIGTVLTELNQHKHKKLDYASLELNANTRDKLYGQGISNLERAGHSTLRGDNAFYLRPTRNDWSEANTHWETFFNDQKPTPNAVRQLPIVSVPGSGGSATKNYLIDVTDLVTSLVKTQQREFTLEMTPQRSSTMAQVTFFAREAGHDKAPKLTITLR